MTASVTRSSNPMDSIQIGSRISVTHPNHPNSGGYVCYNAEVYEIVYKGGGGMLTTRDEIYNRTCGECDLCIESGRVGEHEQSYAWRSEVTLLEKVDIKEQEKIKAMRKTLVKGDWVRIIDPTKIYKDMIDKGKELGADMDKWFKLPVTKDQEGSVIGIDTEGYVLIDIEGSQILLDIEGLVKSKKSTDIEFLLYFPGTKNLEEHTSMDDVNARIEELFASNTVNTTTQMKLYEVKSSKKVNLKLKLDFLG